jgi:ribosome-binding protein aMBF1 (putative translation factor)
MTAVRVILNNRSFVLVPEADWIKASIARLPAGPARKQRRLTPAARGDALPPLPQADAQGNRPALAFADATIARNIIQRRKRLGLSQVGLANLAGIRVEVLNRAERAVTIPSVRTLTKIEAVLQHLEHRAGAKRRRSA